MKEEILTQFLVTPYSEFNIYATTDEETGIKIKAHKYLTIVRVSRDGEEFIFRCQRIPDGKTVPPKFRDYYPKPIGVTATVKPKAKRRAKK